MNEFLIQTKENLEKRGYSVFLCESKQRLLELVMGKILPLDISGLEIGFGHSETLEAINLPEECRCRGAQVFTHQPPLTSVEDDRKALLSDYYFLSANAVSKDGYIVNADGSGNRTAAACFGPKNVIFVISRNKITETLDEAMDRAINYTSVELAKKYADRGILPCMSIGRCTECFSPGCMCGVMTIHRKQLFGHKTSVILVNDDMGI